MRIQLGHNNLISSKTEKLTRNSTFASLRYYPHQLTRGEKVEVRVKNRLALEIPLNGLPP